MIGRQNPPLFREELVRQEIYGIPTYVAVT
jgi:hypothetical protein